ncbi:MAG: GAF domain-containing protein [Candidatus Latescibacter sp.]|nr:GAF domain-containing protein [Candidatus Latescibacter sp.]
MADLSFLIISNDQESLDLVGKKLTEMGYEISVAKSVEEATQLIQAKNFDFAVVDISGKDYSGVEVLRKVMDIHAVNDIIVLTDLEKKKEALRIFGSEIWAYVDKPVDPDELEVIVNRIDGNSCLRKEITDKSRRLSHLEALNEIAREALITRDEDSFLWTLARMINERFNYYNVNMFLMNETQDRVVLKAFAGGFGQDFVVGYSLALGEGLVGWVAQNRQSLIIGDVRKDPRRIQGFAFEDHVLSELAVPITFENKLMGVLHTESLELNAFSLDDLITLETIADQISLSFEKSRLSHELIVAHQLSATINDSMPVPIVIVDRELKIDYVNRTFYEMYGLKRESFLKEPVQNFFSKDLASMLNMEQELADVMETGVSISHTNIRHTSPQHPEKVITISFFRVQAGDYPRGMILIQDVTDYTKKTYQLSLLREITLAMQGVLERDKLLHLILTCVTAGFAIGFNRAFLFLVDKKKKELRGIMGVGPTSQDEAHRIWHELSSNALTFDKYLDNINHGIIVSGGGLQDQIESIAIDLGTAKNILTETVNTGKSFHIVNPWENPLVDNQMSMLIISREFVSIPLIVKNEVIGVLLADNAFSGRPITEDSIEVLTMFAAQAAIAIENAEILNDLEDKVKELQNAYVELEKAQDMIIRNEKLAAIGEVSARLAHEIRNPLATIGGFAKSIQKKYDNRERTIRNANIIVEEVHRLEHILSNVLDFTKIGVLKKTPGDINDLIRKTLSTMEANIVSNGVVVVLDLPEDGLAAEFDETQIKQVLINVIQNSINAMPEGGAIEIKSFDLNNDIHIEIRDTGVGIPKQYLEEIFEPFFTTRGNGTGLGLSISQRIVQNHGGVFQITSKEGVGTTVSINLPKK